jgi:hypothetical protein
MYNNSPTRAFVNYARTYRERLIDLVATFVAFSAVEDDDMMLARFVITGGQQFIIHLSG